MYLDVLDFTEKFFLPAPISPRLLGHKDQLYRLARMLEELHEFQAAHLNGDLTKAADALADLAYFTIGTAIQMGIPFDQVWNLVHQANMEKARVAGAGESKYSDGADIIKPAGWKSPNPAIEALLKDCGA